MEGFGDFQEWLNKILSRDLGKNGAQTVHIHINWAQPPPRPDYGSGGGNRDRKRDKYKSLQDGNSALHDAIVVGNTTLAQELIENKADVNAKNKFGQTPLHLAVKWRQPTIVKELIEKGANTTATDMRGNTPFYVPESEAKPEEKKNPEPQASAVRKRREVGTGRPMLQNISNSYPTNRKLQIGGQSNSDAMPLMADNAVSDAAMLLELAARMMTGARYESHSQVPLSKDQYLDRKLDVINQKLSIALAKFPPDASSDDSRFSVPEGHEELFS